MLEILSWQVVAAISGMVSIAAADWMYQRGRIGQRLHSLWVSSSSAAICLPVLIWTTTVFLGTGILSHVLVGTLAAIMFLWVYRNLQKVPSVQNVASEPLAPDTPSSPVPPSSNA